MGVSAWKIRVYILENRSFFVFQSGPLIFENGSLYFRHESLFIVFLEMKVCFFGNGSFFFRKW